MEFSVYIVILILLISCKKGRENPIFIFQAPNIVFSIDSTEITRIEVFSAPPETILSTSPLVVKYGNEVWNCETISGTLETNYCSAIRLSLELKKLDSLFLVLIEENKTVISEIKYAQNSREANYLEEVDLLNHFSSQSYMVLPIRRTE